MAAEGNRFHVGPAGPEDSDTIQQVERAAFRPFSPAFAALEGAE